MNGVTALGYIGCRIADSVAWAKMLDEIFALECRGDSTDDVLMYRMDEQHHRLALHRSNEDALAYLGWKVETRQELDYLADHLEKNGVAVEWGGAELCAARAVMELIAFEGPDGVRLEAFFGSVQEFQPFTPTRGMEGYHTGEYGLGHVLLSSADREATAAWYQEMLGFRLSDHIFWEGIEATFLHCNPRHHSLAVTNLVGDMPAGELGHFMLESTSLDDVGRAYDIVRDKNYPIALTLGRHTNDHMTSFYVYSPSGWWIEYGYGGRFIDDAVWQPSFYNSPKIWGHEVLPPPNTKEVE